MQLSPAQLSLAQLSTDAVVTGAVSTDAVFTSAVVNWCSYHQHSFQLMQLSQVQLVTGAIVHWCSCHWYSCSLVQLSSGAVVTGAVILLQTKIWNNDEYLDFEFKSKKRATFINVAFCALSFRTDLKDPKLW